jgi:hypothetical protein
VSELTLFMHKSNIKLMNSRNIVVEVKNALTCFMISLNYRKSSELTKHERASLSNNNNNNKFLINNKFDEFIVMDSSKTNLLTFPIFE